MSEARSATWAAGAQSDRQGECDETDARAGVMLDGRAAAGAAIWPSAVYSS